MTERPSEGSEYDILHDVLDAGLQERIGKIYFEDHVRKVPGLESDKKRFIKRIDKLDIWKKFYLQDSFNFDALRYERIEKGSVW